MTRRSGLIIALAIAASSSLAWAPAAFGTGPYFLTIPGYATTTDDTTMKTIPGTMELGDWSFDVKSNATPTTSRTGSAPRVSFGGFTFSKLVDENSGRIALTDLPKGTLIKSATVVARKNAGGTVQTYLKYCFTDLVFTSYRGDSGDAEPKESVTVSFGSMMTSFAPSSPAGNLLAPVRTGWNLLGNLMLGSTVLSKC